MKKIASLTMILALCACGGTKVIDTDNADEVASMSHTMQLEYRDWEKTANSMTKSMISSGAFADIKKPVIAIGTVENDTMQRFDTDILIKKIRSTLINSGRAQVTTSIQNKKTMAKGYIPVSAEVQSVNVSPINASSMNAKAKGYAEVEYEKNVAEDETTHQVRANRGNDEYDQKTIAGKGTLVAPNMSLTGKMLQRNIKTDSCTFCANDERVEYYLQLTLTDVKTGLSVWEEEKPILKEGKHAPTW